MPRKNTMAADIRAFLLRSPWFFTATLIVTLIPVYAFYRGGAWHLLLPLGAYVFVPLGDLLIGVSRWPLKPVEVPPGRAGRFRLVPRLAVTATIALVLWSTWAVSTKPMLWWEFALFALSIGLVSAYLGILPSHELMHRTARTDRRLASLTLAMVCYSHFSIEHVWGHHRHVATRDDPASARYGESLYRFWPRSLIGSLRSAWRIEAGLLGQFGKPVITLQNRLILWHGFSLLLMVAIGLFWGLKSLAFFLLQSLIAVLFLEAINYIQHYGLSRKTADDGSYETVQPAHSWNSSHVVSNLNYLNLGRHSDHHHQMARPYFKLRHAGGAPQAPLGYAGMLLLALVPPLWRRVMHPRIARYRSDAPAPRVTRAQNEALLDQAAE